MRVRKKVKGSSERPRLSIHKSARHLYAQLIDDERGVTLMGVGTLSKLNQNTPHHVKSKAAARHLGEQIAKMAQEKQIAAVIFDRGRYRFHGIVAEFAAGARAAGLHF
jgi:large subunit ribosomal protein L18